LPTILQRVGASLKAAATAFSMSFARGSSWGGRWGSWTWPGRHNYASEVGDGSTLSIVVICIRWITKNFPEAKPRVRLPNADGDLEPVPNHPLVKLLRRPTPWYSGMTIWTATLADWKLGNAYWLKVRSRAGVPVQLWWVPSWMMEPRWPDNEQSTFIGWYEYSPNGSPIRIDPRDVVHFRNGIDPNNLRKGKSELAAGLLEGYTDEEGARFTAAILKNLGVPGVVISPGSDDGQISPDDATQIKADINAKFTGDRRGEPLVMLTKTNVDILSFSPQQMDLKSMRRIPEERLSALIGVPPIVAGLGVGLDHATYSNYQSAREAATEGELVPDWRYFGEELTAQLLPDFEDVEGAEFDFDLSEVRTLQEDQNALAERLNRELLGGRSTLNEVRIATGREPLDGGDVLYLPINVTPTPIESLATLTAPPPAPATVPPPSTVAGSPVPKGLELFKFPLVHELESKASGDYVPAIHRLRDRLQVPFERQVQGYLTRQQQRVLDHVRQDFKGAEGHETKDYGEEVLDWNAEQRALEALFHTAYQQALNGTHNLAQDALGTSFEIDDPLTRAYLQQAGRNIVGITETTQRAISHTLQEGQALGEGVDELAARIQRLGAFGEGRARTIARSELATATNSSTLYAFESSGVVNSVIVHDGTDHDSPCKDINGKTFSLEDARGLPAIEHPNCVRAYAPVTRKAAIVEPPALTNGHAAELVHA
jgi:HK97 family phage portal protein